MLNSSPLISDSTIRCLAKEQLEIDYLKILSKFTKDLILNTPREALLSAGLTKQGNPTFLIAFLNSANVSTLANLVLSIPSFESISLVRYLSLQFNAVLGLIEKRPDFVAA